MKGFLELKAVNNQFAVYKRLTTKSKLCDEIRFMAFMSWAAICSCDLSHDKDLGESLIGLPLPCNIMVFGIDLKKFYKYSFRLLAPY